MAASWYSADRAVRFAVSKHNYTGYFWFNPYIGSSRDDVIAANMALIV
jgi:hypothetical protein